MRPAAEQRPCEALLSSVSPRFVQGLAQQLAALPMTWYVGICATGLCVMTTSGGIHSCWAGELQQSDQTAQC